MPKDLRYFLSRLEERAPGRARPGRARPSTPCTSCQPSSAGCRPSVATRPSCSTAWQGSQLRAISNVLGSTRLLAEALETTGRGKLTQTYIDREDARIRATWSSRTRPSRTSCITGDDIDLASFRSSRTATRTRVPSSARGITTVSDPDTGVHNSGIYRDDGPLPNELGHELREARPHRADPPQGRGAGRGARGRDLGRPPPGAAAGVAVEGPVR